MKIEKPAQSATEDDDTVLIEIVKYSTPRYLVPIDHIYNDHDQRDNQHHLLLVPPQEIVVVPSTSLFPILLPFEFLNGGAISDVTDTRIESI